MDRRKLTIKDVSVRYIPNPGTGRSMAVIFLKHEGTSYIMVKSLSVALTYKVLPYKKDPVIDRAIGSFGHDIDYFAISGKELVWKVWPEGTPASMAKVVFIRATAAIERLNILFPDYPADVLDRSRQVLNDHLVALGN